MDNASGSREPRRGWFSRQASVYRPDSNNEVFVNIEDIEDSVPMRECTSFQLFVRAPIVAYRDA